MSSSSTPHYLWGFWWAGTREVTLAPSSAPESKEATVRWTSVYGCCCCRCCVGERGSATVCATEDVALDDRNVRVRGPSLCACPGNTAGLVFGFYLATTAMAFLLAFMFHLVPSVAIGVEVVLGSALAHQQLGVVWFAGWPVFIILLIGLKAATERGIDIADAASGTRHYVPVGSYGEAAALKAALLQRVPTTGLAAGGELGGGALRANGARCRNICAGVGTALFAFLVVFTGVTANLIMECGAKNNQTAGANCTHCCY